MAKDDISECVMCVFQSQSLLQLRSEMVSLQSELQCLSSTQQGELQAERDLNRTLQEKCRVSALLFTLICGAVPNVALSPYGPSAINGLVESGAISTHLLFCHVHFFLLSSLSQIVLLCDSLSILFFLPL